jgi:isocitrate dehydrogenase kinase/phosphatase
MPRRPLGHHYSTIGFNHVGKIAILNEISDQLRQSGDKLRRSPGAAGTVALGFTFDACSYHLKVIRDRPSQSYKWGAFPGVAAVLEKYRFIHEINRAGSMLDNVMYFNLKLDRDMFDPTLLAEVCREAAGSVQLDGEGVLLRSLIVQLKIVDTAFATMPRPTSLTRIWTGAITVLVATGGCICSTTMPSKGSLM